MKFKHTTNKYFNLGAGTEWSKLGWETLDHDDVTKPLKLRNQAWRLPYNNELFEIVFCSHVIEHISHFQIEKTICEINRVMKKDGILRLIAPDLKKLALAYINNDYSAFEKYAQEDGSGMSYPLGIGQAFMNFIVSPGFDSYLISSDFSEIVGSYAHVYCYDGEILLNLLKRYGFNEIEFKEIHDSEIVDHKELRMVPYDKSASYSIVIECRKDYFVPFQIDNMILASGPYNMKKIVPQPNTLNWSLFKILGYLMNSYKYILSKIPDSIKLFVSRNIGKISNK